MLPLSIPGLPARASIVLQLSVSYWHRVCRWVPRLVTGINEVPPPRENFSREPPRFSPMHLKFPNPLYFTSTTALIRRLETHAIPREEKELRSLLLYQVWPLQPGKPTAALFLPSHTANNTSNLLSAVLLRSFATLPLSKGFPPTESFRFGS